MEELSRAAGLLADKASPWVVDLSMLGLGLGTMIFALTQLGQKLGMFARDLAGNGATPGQVRAIVDEKVNGSDLKKVAEKVAEMATRVGELTAEVRADRAISDKRHADNQRLFGKLEGQLAGRARRV